MRTILVLSLALFATSCLCSATPIAFPQGFVPFSFLDYQTFSGPSGYSLVAGEISSAQAQVQLGEYLSSLPAISDNQRYQNQPIELAPGLFFDNVLVPTAEEIQGDFQDAGVSVYDPKTGIPFPGGIIPRSRLSELFAFRLGPGSAVSTAPEPGGFVLFALGI
ncbi:MAG TPA: hypothetical protein VHZ55_27150, partial [Bryobacteraceae bacterium]|nr:hypothetical protein [Bryobacteraceae bacterium]